MSWLVAHPVVLVFFLVGALSVGVVALALLLVLAAWWEGRASAAADERFELSRSEHFLGCDRFADAPVLEFPLERRR